jgi:hypothetical protein
MSDSVSWFCNRKVPRMTDTTHGYNTHDLFARSMLNLRFSKVQDAFQAPHDAIGSIMIDKVVIKDTLNPKVLNLEQSYAPALKKTEIKPIKQVKIAQSKRLAASGANVPKKEQDNLTSRRVAWTEKMDWTAKTKMSDQAAKISGERHADEGGPRQIIFEDFLKK